ncbi:hypothetical protein N7512_001330 [Penicillium capsulatum]|nr:hypothetical protein N7512_001330 [Penicillium capsulatum]
MFQPLLVLAIQITLAARSPSNLRDSDSQLKGTELPLLFRAPSNLPRTSIVVTGTKWRKGTVWRHKPQDATDITGVKKHPGTQW